MHGARPRPQQKLVVGTVLAVRRIRVHAYTYNYCCTGKAQSLRYRVHSTYYRQTGDKASNKETSSIHIYSQQIVHVQYSTTVWLLDLSRVCS